MNFCVNIDRCEDFWVGERGRRLRVLSTPEQMFSVTQCHYRSFCACAVNFSMAWRSMTLLHVDAVLPDLF